MAKGIAWTSEAKADLRAIAQPIALRILHSIARLASTGQGDAKMLQGFEPPQFRLRVGDYRALYYDHGQWLEILQVKHRKEVYR